MSRKNLLLTGIIAAVAACTSGLVIAGTKAGWGPFGFMYDWDGETDEVVKRYKGIESANGIVFYGASNFRLWMEMENDLKEYRVQNHGFGGSTDRLLVKYADKLLYPYQPRIVCFQTGSNDYVVAKGSDQEKIRRCIEYKKEMFELFHQKIPEARFIVMSGLLLPGRSEYTGMTMEVNRMLQQLCETKDYMYYVNTDELTMMNGEYLTDLFIKDGIHLNHTGQLLWCNNYIRPMLEKVITENGIRSARKDV